MDKRNKEKAQLLYDAVDSSSIFYGVAKKEDRSTMNACFRTHKEEHTQAFLDFAKDRNIVGIKGHRSVGGFRASMYNALSVEDVQQLVSAMKAFESATP